MLRLLFLFSAALLFTACQQECPSISTTASVADLSAVLETRESSDALFYLSTQDVTLKPQRKQLQRGGLFRQAKYEADGAILSGSLTNSASIAKFKDAVLEVTYFSQTKSVIRVDEFTVYEFFEANSTTGFSYKIDTPSQVEEFKCKIVSAQPVLENDIAVRAIQLQSAR